MSYSLHVKTAILGWGEDNTVLWSMAQGTVPSALAHHGLAFLKSRQASLFLPSQISCKRQFLPNGVFFFSTSVFKNEQKHWIGELVETARTVLLPGDLRNDLGSLSVPKGLNVGYLEIEAPVGGNLVFLFRKDCSCNSKEDPKFVQFDKSYMKKY